MLVDNYRTRYRRQRNEEAGVETELKLEHEAYQSCTGIMQKLDHAHIPHSRECTHKEVQMSVRNETGFRDVETQDQLDSLASTGCDERIIIRGGTSEDPICLTQRFRLRPFAAGDAWVRVSEKARIRATEESHVIATDKTDVVADDHSFVRASDQSTLTLLNHARGHVSDRVRLEAFGYSRAYVHGCRWCLARGHSLIICLEKGRGLLAQNSRGIRLDGGRIVILSETARILR